MDAIEELEALARSQRCLFTTKQAEAFGVSGPSLRWRTRPGGPWIDRGYGVWALRDEDGGPLQAAAAALLGAGPAAVLGPTSSAHLHGLDVDLGHDDLIVPPSASGRRPATRRMSLPPSATTTLDGLRALTVPATLALLAVDLDATSWEWALESALHLHRSDLSLGDITAAGGALLRGPRTAQARRTLAAVLGDRGPDLAPCESRLETMFAQLWRSDAELPPLRRQVEIRDRHRRVIARIDFVPVGHKLAIECNGAFHDGQVADDEDRARRILATAGFATISFRWRHVAHQPAAVLAECRRLLRQTAAGRAS